MTDSDLTDAERREQALDLLLYAPIGLALEARDLLPKLAERGRGQVALARVMGKFAAQKGQNEANKVVAAAVDGFRNGLTGPSDAATTSTPANGDAETAEDSTAAVAISHDDLAIEGYDQLAAAQVVKRLPSLGVPELEAIAAYEGANRGRVTILNRVASLLAATDR